MNKVLLFILLLSVYFVNEGLAEVVNIPDAKLKAAIEAELGINNPTEEDMLNLTSLDAQSKGISDLTGIGSASNLSRLRLSANQISDISALSTLKNLTWLSLDHNHISDIAALSKLSSLFELSLFRNQVSDIAALSQLNNLIYLHLHRNQISDISALSQLNSLAWLGLGNNQISDISALSQLNNLTYLQLAGNPLNTNFYCEQLAQIEANNPSLLDPAPWGSSNFTYDPNPNPLTADCSSDIADFNVMSINWSRSDCDIDNNFCGGADMTGDGMVDLADLAVLANLWLNEDN